MIEYDPGGVILRYVNMVDGESTDYKGEVVDFIKATLDETGISQTAIKARIRDLRSRLKEK